MSRGARRVSLIRTNSVSDVESGIYRCEIPTTFDPSTREVSYVGVYNTAGGTWLQSLKHKSTLSNCLFCHCLLGDITDVRITSVTFSGTGNTLQCTSAGGPATTVTWTRDSVVVTEGTETVLHNTVTAQYTHTLTETGSPGGIYTCTVANNKPSSGTSIILTGEHHTETTCLPASKINIIADSSEDPEVTLAVFFWD